jgi:hypothetical protein
MYKEARMTAGAVAFETEQHQVVERVMSELGISWTIETLSVSDVQVEDNLFQTRQNVPNAKEAVVREYADRIKVGDVFPMIVVQEKSPGKYRIVAGRHRGKAYALAQNGKSTYSAYVVDKTTPMDLLYALSARENNANGVRQGMAETAKVAVNVLLNIPLVNGSRRHHGSVLRETANKFGANEATVRDHYVAALVVDEMRRVGVIPGDLQISVLRSLWRWTDSSAWKSVAASVVENRDLPTLPKVIQTAGRDKVDAACLCERIRNAAQESSGYKRQERPAKDPATVTAEHLTFALHDLRDLAPARNLLEEQADEIASLVEAVRVACKEWKSR